MTWRNVLDTIKGSSAQALVHNLPASPQGGGSNKKEAVPAHATDLKFFATVDSLVEAINSLQGAEVHYCTGTVALRINVCCSC